MKLLTKRFVLRDFVREDAPHFEAYHADPRTLQFYDDEDATPGHARDLIELFMAWASEYPRLNYQLAIFRRDDARTLIGCCGLRRAGSEPGKAELGIELAPAHWSRYGYAIEVMEALVDFGFGELGLQDIYGGTVSANSRIARLAESFGAVAVTRPAPAWMVARGWSAVEWQVTRAQWEGGRLTIRSSRRAKARRRT
jgi:[ribosomal protein S5]-alanine N-acetyltransferase